MKKVFVILMCCLSLAFASCKPEKPANEKFIGNYLGTIVMNGTISIPAQSGIPEMTEPIDNAPVQLHTNIAAGENNNSVVVTFTIEGEKYITTGTVVDNTIQFGTLSYHYVEGYSDLTVNLVLTGVLNENKITLSGPFTGSGIANLGIPGLPIAISLTASGDVNGTVNRLVE